MIVSRLHTTSRLIALVSFVVAIDLCVEGATAQVSLVGTHVAAASSDSPFETTVDLGNDAKVTLHSTIDNGRGIPFDILHYVTADSSTDPPTVSQLTMNLNVAGERNEDHTVLSGLGSYSILVKDVEITVEGLSDDDEMLRFFPTAELRSLTDRLTQGQLDDIASQLGTLTAADRGGGRFFRTALHRGNLNSDALVDASDIDLMATSIRENTTDMHFDVDRSGVVDSGDLSHLVEVVFGTWIGDSNLDGEFSSTDLIDVFQAAQYEDGILMNSTWATGDWNGDGDFESGDLVAAFQGGGYERGPRAVVSTVPEPTSPCMLAAALIGFALRSRKHSRAARFGIRNAVLK